MDIEAVHPAIQTAQAEVARPSLIICRTIIGYGSPNRAGTASAHGEPLGDEEVKLIKERLGWPNEGPFAIPREAVEHMHEAVERGKERRERWNTALEAYRREYTMEAAQLEEALRGALPKGWALHYKCRLNHNS